MPKQMRRIRRKISPKKRAKESKQNKQDGSSQIGQDYNDIQGFLKNPMSIQSNADVLNLQRTIGNQATMQFLSSQQIQRDAPRKNNTGLPDHLKSGVEQLSGQSLDDVRVHYNSEQPAKFGAVGYAEGSDIHISPGQESQLPHEAWHVVQQKQGRVKSGMQFRRAGINLDSTLEKEAEMMGGKAEQFASLESRLPTSEQFAHSNKALGQPVADVQRKPVRQFSSGGSDKTPQNTLDDMGDGELVETIKYTGKQMDFAHYAGEDVDSSTGSLQSLFNWLDKMYFNPAPPYRFDGTPVSDAEVATKVRETIPNISDAELTKYFLSGDDNETTKVEYLDDAGRDQLRLDIGGGTIKQGNPPTKFDTTDMYAMGPGDGHSIFVMSPGGDIFSNEHKVGLFHHSSFLASLPAAAAGTLQVKKGKLKHVTDKSGHYKPTPHETYQFMKELKSRGINLSSFTLAIGSPTKMSNDAVDGNGIDYSGNYKSGRAFAKKYEAEQGVTGT